jgi:hypothetical protein
MEWCKTLLLTAMLLFSACSSSSNETQADGGADLAGSDLGEVQEPLSPCHDQEDGTFCDDHEPCTINDLCIAGLCAGTSYSCDWGECGAGACDGEGGCGDEPVAAGWCYIDELCVEDGQSLPENPCLVCAASSPTEGTFAETGAACEDDNVCTEDDFCDNGDCLPGSPPTCADGIQCTADSCDPAQGCIHEPNHELCDDNNPCTADQCDVGASEGEGCLSVADDSLTCADKNVCTTNDHCLDGDCVSDPDSIDCDDSNMCTDESCHPAYGCLFVFNEIPCNDQAECTLDDLCNFGKCIGTEQWWGSCPVCDLTFSEQVVKLVNLRVGDGGFPGEALNVDNDLKTCSPDGNCEQGLDNSLMLAGDFIDETLSQNLVNLDNPLIFTVEFVEPTTDGEEFVLNLYYASVADSNPVCDFQHDLCEYDVSGLNFDPLCNNQVVFNNTTIVDGVLNAGGSGFIFPFKASFTNGESSETVLYAAKVQADVTFDDEGKVAGLKGVIGGAITKENLIDLIMAIPEDYLPVPPELIVTFVENIPQDIDLDGDGTTDASSIALVFDAIPATLLPYYQ